MSPGFFLKLAENTGDDFAYHVLVANNIKDIPQHRNLVVLVRCVVRRSDLVPSDEPRCSKDVDWFRFYKTNGDELFSNVENETNLAEQELVDEELSRSDGVTSLKAAHATSGQPQSQSSTSLLTLDVDLSTILEKQEDEDINDCPITEEHITNGVDLDITPGVSPTDDALLTLPHVPIVSQTQSDD